ncbi:MAG: sulfite exporter TauE/SafE family protein [Hyphomicrobiales bacterium]|nr:MAG: sulfite exporter TauE/SafE family protein [Hyphomicrobiales bacterium]
MDLLVQNWPLIAALSVTGMVSGVFAGLLGIGGGAIIVPVLALALEAIGLGSDLAQHVAVASSLAIIIPTGIMSARSHFKRGAVDVAILKLWAPFVLGGCLIGGLMAGLFSGDVLRIVFGVMAIFIAINIVTPFQQRLMGHLRGSPTTHRVAASIVGYLSALMGIGGGSLSVPTIAAFGETMHKAVGTGAAIGVFIAVGGTIGFIISGWGLAGLPPLSLGYVNFGAFALVGGFAALLAPVGVMLAHRLDQKTLKYVFAAFLVLVGLNMIWKAISG